MIDTTQEPTKANQSEPKQIEANRSKPKQTEANRSNSVMDNLPTVRCYKCNRLYYNPSEGDKCGWCIINLPNVRVTVFPQSQQKPQSLRSNEQEQLHDTEEKKNECSFIEPCEKGRAEIAKWLLMDNSANDDVFHQSLRSNEQEQWHDTEKEEEEEEEELEEEEDEKEEEKEISCLPLVRSNCETKEKMSINISEKVIAMIMAENPTMNRAQTEEWLQQRADSVTVEHF